MSKIKYSIGFLAAAALCLFAPIPQAKAENDNIYGVEGQYSVTIPAELTIPTDAKSAELPIEVTSLAANTNLVIEVKSENDYKLYNGDKTNNNRFIGYTLSDKKPLVFSNASNEKTSENYTLKVTLANKTLLYSGEYTDTLTFNMTASQIEGAAKTHELIFNLNTDAKPGHIAEITTDKKILAENEAYGTLPTPRRTGYDFKGWYTDNATQDETAKVSETTPMLTENVTLYAKWEIHTFKNTMTFWAWGLKGEGNNGPGTAIKLADDTNVGYETNYGDSFEYTKKMAEDYKVAIPRGYKFEQFGSATVPGQTKWGRVTFGENVAKEEGHAQFTQPDWVVNAEYEFDPVDYKITYELDDGVNNKDNPSTYKVLYGVTFKEPTKEGYTFDGWYIGDERVYGINENHSNDVFAYKTICEKNPNVNERLQLEKLASEAFYAELEKRTAKDITVTAKWTPISSEADPTSNDETFSDEETTETGETAFATYSTSTPETAAKTSKTSSATPETAEKP